MLGTPSIAPSELVLVVRLVKANVVPALELAIIVRLAEDNVVPALEAVEYCTPTLGETTVPAASTGGGETVDGITAVGCNWDSAVGRWSATPPQTAASTVVPMVTKLVVMPENVLYLVDKLTVPYSTKSPSETTSVVLRSTWTNVATEVVR